MITRPPAEPTNGRPAPGTIVRFTDTGKVGTVEYYETYHNSTTFPVQFEEGGRLVTRIATLVSAEVIAKPKPVTAVPDLQATDNPAPTRARTTRTTRTKRRKSA